MAQSVVKNVAYRGVVGAVPGAPISVFDLGASIDPADAQKMAQTVGLKELYKAAPGQTAGDLCTAAAERLLEELDWDRSSVDGLILVTQTPDHFSPATACVAHGKLGLPDTCMAFDIGMGCSGYVYGLWVASQMVASRTCRRVLLLAGDTLRPMVSLEDKSVALLFGDAGSATALEYDPTASDLSFVMGTDGSGAFHLGVPAGAFRMRPTAELSVPTPDEDGNVRSQMDLYMDGLAVFNFTLKRVPALIQDTVVLAGWTIPEVDEFVFHQANAFMLGRLAKKTGIAPDRMPINIDRYGNTSLTSIPLVLADDLAKRIGGPEAVRIVMAGFGVGLSWAAVSASLSGVRVASVIHV